MASEPFNAYTVLGVTPTATAAEVKRAYLRLAASCHPDKGGSADEFARVQRAYSTLTDPQQKLSHDDALKRGQPQVRNTPGVFVHGQTSGHRVTQHGVVAGVTVTVHGQSRPPPREEPTCREAPHGEECEDDTDGQAQAVAGHAALSRGEYQAAVHAFTRALRACAADERGGQTSRGALSGLYSARAAAHAALGDHRRAQADADEAEELAAHATVKVA